MTETSSPTAPDSFAEHVRRLMDGSDTPKNEFSKKVISAIKDAHAEHAALLQSHQAREQEIVKLRVQLQRLEGAMEAQLALLKTAEDTSAA